MNDIAQIMLKNVEMVYKLGKSNQCRALTEIDLEINNGELVALVGTSGSGKTTLLSILGGIIKPTKGEYYYNNHLVTLKNISTLQMNELSFIFQDYALIENETVGYNVSLPLWLDKTTKINQIKIRVEEALEKVGLSEFYHKKVKLLSGGQKQRVAIARAIVKNVNLILADEPTGSLDNENTENIINLLKNINQSGITVIIVTHDLNVANECQRVIELSDGKIINDSNVISL